MKNFHLFLSATLLLFLSACQEKGPETPSGPLPAPQNVHCTDVTTTSLTFAWDAVDGAERYAVRLKTASDGVVVEAGYATSATYTFSDLETGTSYICMVRAIAGDRFSEFVSSSSYVPGESTPDPEPDPDPDPDMTEAYKVLGAKKIKETGFSDTALRQAISEKILSEQERSIPVKYAVYKEFKSKTWYSNKEINSRLKQIYERYGIDCDGRGITKKIGNYFRTERKTRRGNAGYMLHERIL